MKAAPLQRSLALCAVALAILLSVLLRPTASMRDASFDLEVAIPTQFGGWLVDPRVVPIAPTPDVQAQLAEIYDQIVSRTYVNSAGERVMLAITYGGQQNDSLHAHRQEVCYRAQGFTVTRPSHAQMTLQGRALPVVRVHASLGSRSEPVTYWMTMGNRIVWRRDERMLTQVRYGLQGTVPDGFLVRVSSLALEPASGYRTQERFLESLMAALPPGVSGRLLGQGS